MNSRIKRLYLDPVIPSRLQSRRTLLIQAAKITGLSVFASSLSILAGCDRQEITPRSFNAGNESSPVQADNGQSELISIVGDCFVATGAGMAIAASVEIKELAGLVTLIGSLIQAIDHGGSFLAGELLSKVPTNKVPTPVIKCEVLPKAKEKNTFEAACQKTELFSTPVVATKAGSGRKLYVQCSQEASSHALVVGQGDRAYWMEAICINWLLNQDTCDLLPSANVLYDTCHVQGCGLPLILQEFIYPTGQSQGLQWLKDSDLPSDVVAKHLSHTTPFKNCPTVTPCSHFDPIGQRGQ